MTTAFLVTIFSFLFLSIIATRLGISLMATLLKIMEGAAIMAFLAFVFAVWSDPTGMGALVRQTFIGFSQLINSS